MLRILLIVATLIVQIPIIANDASDSEKQAVKDALTAMWDAVERGDIDTYASWIHSEHSTFGEGDVYLQEGKRKEVESIKDWMQRARKVHTEMHQEKVTIVGDIAWITYYWTDSGYTDNGRYSSRGKSTRIFQKVDGKWLSRHGHFTEVP